MEAGHVHASRLARPSAATRPARFAFMRAIVSPAKRQMLATDEVRARAESRGRVRVTIALVLERSGRLERTAGAAGVLPLTPLRVAQRCRPALADIIGARRAWTVAMISSVSMPCR